MKMPEDKALYGLRKQTPQPVFGIIKSVPGFRRFLLRGIDRVRSKWGLVTMAWNMKRRFALTGATPNWCNFNPSTWHQPRILARKGVTARSS